MFKGSYASANFSDDIFKVEGFQWLRKKICFMTSGDNRSTSTETPCQSILQNKNNWVSTEAQRIFQSKIQQSITNLSQTSEFVPADNPKLIEKKKKKYQDLLFYDTTEFLAT